MNINNQLPVTTNFKGVDKRIATTLASHPEKLGVDLISNIRKNLPRLKASEAVDLKYNSDGDVVIVAKETLNKIFCGKIDIPAGTEIRLYPVGSHSLSVSGSKLRIEGVQFGKGHILDAVVDLGTPEFAQYVCEQFGIHSDVAIKTPDLGALIDYSQRIFKKNNTKEMKNMMAKTLYG